MRFRMKLGALLAVGICGVLLLVSRLREMPVPATLPHADAPDAPPADPGPLVGPELTEEERVLEVARAYLLAWHEWDFEAVWELMSKPARNVWAEILGAEDHGDSSSLWNFRDLAEEYNAARFEDPRALFLSTAKEFVESPSAQDSVQGETPAVVIEDAKATVTWSQADLRLHLGREGAGWRVHAMAEAVGMLSLLEAPGGRKIPVIGSYDLIRRDAADLDTWWPRLPRLPGDHPEEADFDAPPDDITLYVDSHGGVRRFGLRLSPEMYSRFLFQRADFHRDMNDPGQPCTLWNILYLDRDLPGENLRKILLLLTAAVVRMKNLHLVARYRNTSPDEKRTLHGLSLVLSPVYLLTTCRFRVEETAVDLILRDVEEAVFGEDLTRVLNDLPEDDRKKGLRLRFGPRVPTERLVLLLHALAQQEDLRIVLDIREETVPETRWGLEFDGKPVRLVNPTGKVKTELKLEVWR